MSQSQNAIFTSPTGEENLMNSNHRDSESITGECSFMQEIAIASKGKTQTPQSGTCSDGLQPDLLRDRLSQSLHARVSCRHGRIHLFSVPCVSGCPVPCDPHPEQELPHSSFSAPQGMRLCAHEPLTAGPGTAEALGTYRVGRQTHLTLSTLRVDSTVQVPVKADLAVA